MRSSKTLATSLWAGAATLVVGASLLTLPGATPAGAVVPVLPTAPGMRCYPARRLKGVVVEPVTTQLEDIFQKTNSTIGKPFMVCVPGDAVIPNGAPINVTVIKVPLVAQVCYKVKDGKNTPKFPTHDNPVVMNLTVPVVGPDVLQLGKSSVFCLQTPLPFI